MALHFLSRLPHSAPDSFHHIHPPRRDRPIGRICWIALACHLLLIWRIAECCLFSFDYPHSPSGLFCNSMDNLLHLLCTAWCSWVWTFLPRISSILCCFDDFRIWHILALLLRSLLDWYSRMSSAVSNHPRRQLRTVRRGFSFGSVQRFS